MREFQLAIVGPRGAGKTAFTWRQFTGEFPPPPHAPGVSALGGCRLRVHTSTHGPVAFRAWDVTSVDDDTRFLLGAQCALLVVDLTRRASYGPETIADVHRRLVHVCGGRIPIALCGNKLDAVVVTGHHRRQRQPQRLIRKRRRAIRFHHGRRMRYFELSVKASYGLDAPLEWLARELLGDPQLKLFVPPCECAMWSIPGNILTDLEGEMAAAAAVERQEDDEDDGEL